MFSRLRSCSAITVLFFVFSFVSIVQSEPDRRNVAPVAALDDITFINGEWSGSPSDCPECPPRCAVFNFLAGTGNNFNGDLRESCGDEVGSCSFTGTISINNNSIQASLDCPGGCTTSFDGSFGPSRTTMNLTLHDTPVGPGCSAGSFTLPLSREQVGVLDVSQSSGIANQNVQTSGVQWIDYNNDKRLDLYLVGHNGNVLFKNVGNGKFVDVTTQTKTGNNGKDASGASWADIDNDGDLDVFIANAIGAPTLLLNKKKVFQDISNKIDTAAANASAGFTLRAGIWVDINNDRKSDLFLIWDGLKNQLFKQTGSLVFTELTTNSGIDHKGAGRSALAADFNEDGFQDLYVINFGESNRLYKNNGSETFSDVTQSAGVGFNGKSVGATLADYDNDQDLDIFVVNSAGSPVLYENLGNLKFKNSTPGSLKIAKKGIAAAFFDIDNDQDQDLIVAQLKARNLVFDNLGSGKFKVDKGIDLSRPDNPSGIAIGDFNGDLIPDIIIGDADAEQENGDSLYQNTGAGGNNSLTLVLRGTKSSRDAIGARILIQTDLTFQTRTVTPGNGQSQDSLPLVFGLGPNLKVDRIQINWPSGTFQEMNDVDANRTYTITEP